MGCVDKLQAMKNQMEMENKKKRRRRSAKKGKVRESIPPGTIAEAASTSLLTKTAPPSSPPPPPPPSPLRISQQFVASSPAFYVFESQYNILSTDWVSIGLDPTVNFAPRLRFFEPSYNAYIILDKEIWMELLKLEEQIMYNFTRSDIVPQFPCIQTKFGTYNTQFECLFGEKFFCLEYNNNNNNNTAKKYFRFEVIKELFKMKNILSHKMQFLEKLNFQKYYYAIIRIIIDLWAHHGNNSEDLQHYISLLIDTYTNADMPETLLGICFLETAHFLNSKMIYDITDMLFAKELFSLSKE